MHQKVDPENLNEKKAFYWALWIAFTFMLIELFSAWIANSLALVSDALHMFTDVGALFLGIVVAHLMQRPSTRRRSYGYQRSEALGALMSGITLWVLIFFLVYESIQRLVNPPEVKGFVIFIVATFGLVANIAMLKLLHPKDENSLNLKAAYLHVLSDLLSSVGILIGGIILWITKWNPIDPILTLIFSLIILFSSGKMILEALKILLEWAPGSIDPDAVFKDLASLEGVKEVHDLHIWSITTQKAALSVHLISSQEEKSLLQKTHSLLLEKYSIQHMTIQIEDPDHFETKYCYDCENSSS